jgi:YgiT-type zinc finger domain-containing protein
MFEISSCPGCGSQGLRRVCRDLEAEYQGDAYRVERLEFFECPDCGGTLYPREAMRRIEAQSPAFAKTYQP